MMWALVIRAKLRFPSGMTNKNKREKRVIGGGAVFRFGRDDVGLGGVWWWFNPCPKRGTWGTLNFCLFFYGGDLAVDEVEAALGVGDLLAQVGG